MSQRTPMGPISWVLTIQDLRHLIAAIRTATLAVPDLETTGLHEHAVHGGPLNGGYPARIVLASFTLEQADEEEPTTWVVPLSHPDGPWCGRWRAVLGKISDALLAAEVPISNQNVKFDARWIYAHTRRDLSGLLVWDTQVSSHLLDENSSTKLKERAPETFGIPRWDDDVDLTYPGAAEETDIYDLGEYAARDTYWTWRLTRRHRTEMFLDDADHEPETPDEITQARLGRVATWVSMPTVATLTEIEQRGIGLDRAWVVERLREEEEGYRDAVEAIAHRYGSEAGLPPEDVSVAPTSHWFRRFAEVAVERGDLRVAALTPNGVPQWSKGVLTRQARQGSEVAQMVLDARGHKKLAEYLSSWLEHVSPDDRIHATYHVGSVLTGRLSSSSPNMQQVTKALRPAFVPSPGSVLADFDYSQIELRVAAFVSRCEPMLSAFREGQDLHRLLAQQIVQRRENGAAARERRKPRVITLDDVTAEERQAGKSANFGLLYGMGPLGFREYAETVYGVTFTTEEAEEVHRTFFDTWDGMAQWHHRQVRRVNELGYVVSPIGRVRRLPEVWDGNERVASHAERNAINSPVQGFASDLMQMAAASIAGKLPGHERVRGARLVATVHDSIVAELDEDRWEEIAEECRERMTSAILPVLRRLDCHLDVPLVADVTAGTRWGLSDISDPEPAAV